MALLLRGGHLFLSGGAVKRGDVLIEDGRIAAVGSVGRTSDVESIDLDERWVLPGFIDLHVHFTTYMNALDEPETAALRGAQRARRALATGITTVRDVGGYGRASQALKRAIDRGWMPGPRMVTCGQYITITGGHGHERGIEADGVEEVRKAVRQQLRAGAEWIKIMASAGVSYAESPDRPNLTLEEMRTAVEEAGRRGVRVAAHAHPAEAIKDALRAGVGSIEHGSFVDDEAIELFLQTSAILVPTIAAYEHVARSGKFPGLEGYALPIFEYKMKTFPEIVERGVRWGVGTDSATRMPIDYGYPAELRVLQRAGLESREILLRATKVNAELLGLHDQIGTLEAGKVADIVVLQDDPLQDLSGAERVYLVVKSGRPYWPRDLRPSGPE